MCSKARNCFWLPSKFKFSSGNESLHYVLTISESNEILSFYYSRIFYIYKPNRTKHCNFKQTVKAKCLIGFNAINNVYFSRECDICAAYFICIFVSVSVLLFYVSFVYGFDIKYIVIFTMFALKILEIRNKAFCTFE